MEEPVHVRVPFEDVPVLVRELGPHGAPLALFAHPFPLHGACWDGQLVACAREGFRAAAIDAPGFGGSPPLGRHLRMEDIAQILALTLDALQSPRAVLVGCSMGGYAVQAFARQYPERLAGAVLMCTKAAPDTVEQRERREKQALTALSKGAPAVVATLLPNLLSGRYPDAIARAQQLAAGATAQGVADALRGMAERPDSRPALPAFPAPALVLSGEYDKVMSDADAEELALGIPHATRTALPAGHLAPLELPAEVSALIVSFLRACRAANAWSRRAGERREVEFL
jgi:pimeloyl-ACP methyl ester carboxylesterase